jgi:hypothetical protein
MVAELVYPRKKLDNALHGLRRIVVHCRDLGASATRRGAFQTKNCALTSLPGSPSAERATDQVFATGGKTGPVAVLPPHHSSSPKTVCSSSELVLGRNTLPELGM